MPSERISGADPAATGGRTDKDQFLGTLRNCVDGHTLVRLVLGKYRGPEADLRNVVVRAIQLRGCACLSFVYRYRTRDITRNASIVNGLETIRDLLGQTFFSAHLFAVTEDAQIVFNKGGEGVVTHGKASSRVMPDEAHDHAKQRVIDPRRPFLNPLGITDAHHKVLPSMSRKWKQINVFLAILQRALQAARPAAAPDVHVVDFGCGKGYLTFAVYDLLRNALGLKAQVTGVEVRSDLVRFCNETAAKLNWSELSFRQGTLQNYAPGKIDILIALHACDTATDEAINMGIRAGAALILCAPCCHKELRPQLRSPAVVTPMLRFGVHLGQEAEMLTDSLRALLLEAHGYEGQVFEFVAPEHTTKNKMILAVRRRAPASQPDIPAQIRALKEFYGINEQRLESLLNAGGVA